MKKRVFAFLLAVISAGCMFASCGDDKKKDKDTKSKAEDSVVDSYVEKSKKSSAMATASTIHKAACCALADLDEQGFSEKSAYLICSDSSKNLMGNITGEIPFDKFNGLMKNYVDDLDKYEYIIVMYDGTCIGTAVKMENGYVGTYPLNAVADIKSYPDNIKSYNPEDKIDFDEVYNAYKEQIQ